MSERESNVSSTKAQQSGAPRQSREEVLRLIVEEVDAARDTYELVSQLEHALPIRSFEDLRKAAGEKGELRFRGTTFNVAEVEGLLPPWAFPVEDLRALVERVAHAVRLTPPDFAVDRTNPDFVSRQMRRQLFGGIPNGLPPHAAMLRSTWGTIPAAPSGPAASEQD